ncbi:Mobile element protein [Pseudomonas sp. NGC7]
MRLLLETVQSPQVVQERLQPGATVSSVATSHGINANVIRKWLPLHRDQPVSASLPAFVPLKATPNAQHRMLLSARPSLRKPRHLRYQVLALVVQRRDLSEGRSVLIFVTDLADSHSCIYINELTHPWRQICVIGSRLLSGRDDQPPVGGVRFPPLVALDPLHHDELGLPPVLAASAVRRLQPYPTRFSSRLQPQRGGILYPRS